MEETNEKKVNPIFLIKNNVFDKIVDELLHNSIRVAERKEEDKFVQFFERIDDGKWDELMEFIKDYFFELCYKKILRGTLIDKYQMYFNDYHIYHNFPHSTNGNILVDGHNLTVLGEFNQCVVMEYGFVITKPRTEDRMEYQNSIFAYDNATVSVTNNDWVVAAHDEVTVVATGEAFVNMHDKSRATLYGESKGILLDSATCECHDISSVKAFGENYVVCHEGSFAILHRKSCGRAKDKSKITAEYPEYVIKDSEDAIVEKLEKNNIKEVI